MTLHLPAPAPYEGPDRCPDCAGAKVTGDRYEWPAEDTGKPFVVDVLCPTCDGCGRADHIGCVPLEHGEYDPDDPYEDDEEPTEDTCPFCHGRTWWPCQGFPPDGDAVLILRMPCGCAEPLMVEAP